MGSGATWGRLLLAAAVVAAGCSGASGANEAGDGGTGGGGTAATGGTAGGGGTAGETGGTGNTGNEGSGGTGNVIAVGGGPTDGGLDPDAACATSQHQGEQVPLDMFIMMDQSGSMKEPSGSGTTWDAIKGALTTFVNSPESAGMGVGIGYFPLEIPCAPGIPDCQCIPPFPCLTPTTSSCNANDYAVPDVLIQLLPGVAPQIVSSLAAHSPNGGTPTHPAIQGAMQVALNHAVANPNRKVIVVLATDGAPNHCSSNVGNVSQVAGTGFANVPSILTFVIGIGNVGNLNQIAMAGGTGTALIVNTANAGQDFLDAMNAIRGKALGCEFNVPEPEPGETLDPKKVNVRFTPPGGSGEILYKVPDEAGCDPVLGGWYYDDDANPSSIFLCPATCDRITVEQGLIEIELGCDTTVIPQ